MLAEITKKQRELDDLRHAYQELRTFVLELRRATKNKLFDVRSTLAWEGMLALHRIIVIDLAAWIDSLLPPRDPRDRKRGQIGWLEKHLQATGLASLASTPLRAVTLAAKERMNAPPDVEWLLRDQLAQEFLDGHRAALERLFGRRAAHRGPTVQDVQRLEKRLFTWAQNLRRWRNRQAHRYGVQTTTVRAIRLADLVPRFERCSRIMNDLRLLHADSTYLMAPLVPSSRGALAEDMVDLIVVGTMPYAVAEFMEQHPDMRFSLKRDAHYRRMHHQKWDPFNRQHG